MKKVTLIAAVGYGDNGIGAGGKLPWHLPEDLKRFRALTMGKHCAVGYRTYLHMPYLYGRITHVVPKNGTLSPARFADFLGDLERDGIDDLKVIGGARVYAAAMPFATHMELTRVGIQLPIQTCDAFFPEYDWADWEVHQEFCEEDKRLTFMSMTKR